MASQFMNTKNNLKLMNDGQKIVKYSQQPPERWSDYVQRRQRLRLLTQMVLFSWYRTEMTQRCKGACRILPTIRSCLVSATRKIVQMPLPSSGLEMITINAFHDTQSAIAKSIQ